MIYSKKNEKKFMNINITLKNAIWEFDVSSIKESFELLFCILKSCERFWGNIILQSCYQEGN